MFEFFVEMRNRAANMTTIQKMQINRNAVHVFDEVLRNDES